MCNAWKLKQGELTWETYLEPVDIFLDDEDCFLIDQMRNPEKFLMQMLCLVTLVSSLPATRRENQYVMTYRSRSANKK